LSSLVAGIASDRLRSLSLIEGLGPLTRPPATSPSQLAHYLKHLTTNSIKPAKGYKEFQKAAEMRASKGYVSLDIATKLCERGLEERDGLYYWRHDRRLLSHSPLQMTEAQVLPCLKQISVPTLLLWADQGFSLSEELMALRMNAVHDLTMKELAGGHHVHMEEPEAVARLLTEFYHGL
jgi:pimeloyl-ACP methyl ester carboxylesterase